jgi:hypothetical protein
VIGIPEGKGAALGDIPRIDAVLQVSIISMNPYSSDFTLAQITVSIHKLLILFFPRVFLCNVRYESLVNPQFLLPK